MNNLYGSYTRTAPGRITIEVPISDAYAKDPLTRTLYSVIANTMTLAVPADTPAPSRTGSAYVGGSFFNLIDSASSYDFIPQRLDPRRKSSMHAPETIARFGLCGAGCTRWEQGSDPSLCLR